MLLAALIVPWVSSAQDCTQTVPYLEGFEGVTGTAYNTAGTLPACWNGYYNGTTAAYVPHVVTGTGNYNYQHSGVNSLVMTSGSSSTYGNTKIVMLPPMAVPLNQLQLSFWMCTESASYGTLYVGYVTSNDTSSFVPIASYPASSATVHSGNGLQAANVGQEIELPLATVPATATRLAFKWYHNSTYYSCCIDDVVVGYPPTCPKPFSMAFSNIAATEATVSWIPTGSETQWEIVYNGQSVIANDTTYTFTDLTPNTQYDVAIRAICSAADSSYFINGNFRTSCTAISSLPYQNGFEDDPFYLSGVTAYADAFPSCWTRINDASSASYNYYPYISTTTSYVHSGQNALYWYHTTTTTYANNQYAVLPPVDLNAYSISDLTLAFYAKTTSSSYHPQPIVGVMTDPGDASTFTAVETFSDSAITTEWKLFVVPLASYTGNGNYIAIKWPRPSSLCYMAIDDVFLTDGWCDALEGDVQAASTSDEITITWSPDDATSFTVFVGTDTVTNVTDTSYTFTDLTPNTEYNYGVAVECASSISMFVGGSIYTQCVPVDSLPWVYGFEDATANAATAVFNTCMGRYREGTTTAYPYPNATHHGDGAHGLYMYSTSSVHSWITFPQFEEEWSNLSLTFYAYRSTTATYGHWAVGVMTDPADITTFDTIASGQVSANSLWELVEVTLSNYTGDGQYLAILCPKGTGTNYTYIDDITVDFLPPCPTPTDPDTLNVTSNSAELVWNASADEYIIEYGIQGFTQGQGNVVSAYSNSVSLENLVLGTTYGVYITAICGEDTSNPIYTSFTTGCAALTQDDLPYFETFEAYGTGSSSPINACWSKGTSSSTAYPYPYSTAAITGNRGLYLYGYYPSSTSSSMVYSWAALPPIDESLDMNNLMVTFNVKRGTTASNYYQTLLYVGIADDVTTLTNAAAIDTTVTWIDTLDYFSEPASSVHSAEVSFADYLGMGKYVVFYAPIPPLVGSSTYAYNYVYLDDVALRTIPTCFWPTEVSLDSITSDAATISWMPDTRTPDPSGWNIEYGLKGFVPGFGETTTASDTTAVLTDLLPNTEYDVYVSADCGGDVSDPTVFTFRTLCEPVPTDSLPYFEGFESYVSGAANPISPCWYKKVIGSTTNYPYPNTSAAVTGNIGLYSYAYGSIYEYAALPLFDEDLTNLMLDFDLKRGTSSGATYHTMVYVGVMSVAEDLSTFDTIAYIDDSDNPASSVTHHRVSFEGYEGTGRIAFLWPAPSTTSHYNYAHIDNVAVDLLPDCRWPAQLAVDNTTGTSIDISWVSTEGSDFRVVATNAAGTVIDSADVTTTSYSFTGLTPQTNYTIRVATICSDTISEWATLIVNSGCTTIDSLPWIEDFDSYAATTSATDIPCWAHLGAGYVNFYTTSGNHLYSGTSLRFYPNGSTAGNILVLPSFSTPISDLEISLMSKPEGTSSGSFSVGYVTNPTDAASFVEVQEYPISYFQATGSVAYTLVTNTFAGAPDNARIALRHNVATTSWYWFIDSVNVHAAPVCMPIGAIEATTSTDSIVLTWSHVEGQTTWYVTCDNGYSAVVNDSTATITGLTPNTLYTFEVSSICGEGDTSNATSIMVRTDCAAITTLPFAEDFESQTTGTSTTGSAFIPCWGHLNNGTSYGGYPYVSSVSTYNHTPGGSKGLYWYGATTTGSYGDYQIVILPPIDTVANPINTLQFSFWARSSSTSYNPVFYVGVMTDPTNPATAQIVDTINVGGNTEWVEFITSFEGFAGHGQYIALGADRPTSTWYAYVDDIVLDAIPACAKVEDITATNVLLSTATISWTDTSDNASWYVEYDNVEFTPGTGHMTALHVTDTFCNLTGLDSGTVYHVYVYPDCYDTGVYARHYTFSTLAASPASIPYTCDFEATGVNGWDLVNGAQVNHWIVGDATSNGGSQSLYITNNDQNNSYTITSASYVFAVRNVNIADSGHYVFSFDWKSGGESSYDFIRAALVPASTEILAGDYSGFDNTSAMPAGGIALDGGFRLNLQDTWQTQVSEFYVANPGLYKIVFLWRNDLSGGTQPPAAIDNVVLQVNTCPRVENVTATLNSNSIDLVWTPGGAETQWQVTLGTTTAVVSTPAYTATGLTPDNDYTFSVRPICGAGDTGVWHTETLHTPCSAVSLPYSENFDNLTTSTTAATGVQVDCWNYIMTGTSTYQTATYQPQVYYSSTYAQSGSYSLRLYGESYTMMPMMPVSLDSLQLTFWEYNSGASYLLEVGVMEGNNFVPIQTITTNASTHAQHTVYFGSYTGNSRIIAFRNHNSSSTSYISTHYIDNVTVDYLPSCPPVTNIEAVSASTSELAVDWIELASAQSWQVSYREHGTSAYTTISTTSHPVVISGLDTLTSYDVIVRPICSAGDTGEWSQVALLATEFCDEAVVAATGAQTGTGYTTPVNNLYKYTLTETIIDSAELVGLGDIEAIAYSYAYSTAMTDKTDVTIWLQHTNKSVFSSSSDLVALDTTIAVRVYQGALNCSQGWNYFILDTTFAWDGHSNLLVIVDDNSFDYNSSSYTFNTTSCSGYKTLAWYSDSQNPDPTSSTFTGTKGYYQYRATMKLVSCGAGCSMPAVSVTNIDAQSATVTAYGTGMNYEMQYGISNGDFDYTLTSATGVFNLTGLEPETQYFFSVRQQCDTNFWSNWYNGTFTTDELGCMAPTALAVTATDYTSASLSWTVGNEETAWEVHVFSNTLDTFTTVTTTTPTIGGLAADMPYSAAVRALCGSSNDIPGPWSDTITFTTAACEAVTNVTVAAGSTTATVSWTGTSTSYRVIWGLLPFNPQDLEGEAIVATNSYIITGLDEETDYAVVIYNNCAEGISVPSTPVNFTTTSGGVEPTIYTVVVVANNPAWGTVTGSGQYAEGSTVTITATANEGYHFEMWSDGNTEATRSFTITSNVSLTANFAEDGTQTTYYTVSVSSNNEAWGTVTGGGQYAEGTTATIGATAANGYRFVEWNDHNTDNPRSFTVTADMSFTATFEAVENGIEDVVAGTVSLYPNPASTSVTLGLEGFEGESIVEVVDMNGRVVMRHEVRDSKLEMNVSELPQGAYFVRVTNGTRTAISKLIVK